MNKAELHGFRLYSWMQQNGYSEAALPACEALFSHLSWIVMVSEAVMLPIFIYWFYLVLRGKTRFPKRVAFGNVLVFYFVLTVIKNLLPDSPFRLGFTNGLMSESMIFFFGILWFEENKMFKN